MLFAKSKSWRNNQKSSEKVCWIQKVSVSLHRNSKRKLFRSCRTMSLMSRCGEIGKRERLKISWPVMALRVRFPLSAQEIPHPDIGRL